MGQIIKSKLSKNPPGLYIIIYTQLWELFGRFGITALLVLYMTKTLHLSDQIAFVTYSTFFALTYLMPLLGGAIADKFLGFKKSILLGACIMSIGNLLIIIPKLYMVYLGLSVVAIGSGLFTPTIAVMMGKLYQNCLEKRDKGFVLFYVGQNIGILLAPLICGFISERYGYNYAFIVSGLGMLSGFIVFALGAKKLNYLEHKIADITCEQKNNIISSKFLQKNIHFFSILSVLILIPVTLLIFIKHIYGYALLLGSVIAAIVVFKAIKKSSGQNRADIFFIIIVAIVGMIFYGVLCQGGTTLNLFIDRIVNRQIFGFTVPTTALFTLDPFFMLLLSALIIKIISCIYKPNYYAATLKKFILGFLFFACGFLVFVFASASAYGGIKTSMLYIVFAYSIFPLAELCIMPIALSAVTRLAPKHLSATMVGVYNFGLAAASFITALISKRGSVDFPIDGQLAIVKAAHTYNHVFLLTVAILVLVAIAIYCLLATVYTTTRNLQ